VENGRSDQTHVTPAAIRVYSCPFVVKSLIRGSRQREWLLPFEHCQVAGQTCTKGRMPSVAEQLRQAREQRNLSVHQVAEATKIKTDHIRALEAGHYEVFAATVYIRGFVRAYATLLRLDVPQLMVELDGELSLIEQFRGPSSLLPKQRTFLDVLSLLVAKVHWRLVLSFAVFVIIVLSAISGYRAWRRSQATDPLGNLGPGLFQPRQSNPGEMLPLPAPGPPRK
ncbi:MAG: helix-turn-helix domain-containing protein, partial [Verrucomicrobiales bacterium]|nr:helix-turn-helix domain-containing protein [Verrucomicrobiales bacterium]